MFSFRPARFNAFAGAVTVAAVLAPTALSAGSTDVGSASANTRGAQGHTGRKKGRPEPVRWLPREDDRNAMRGRSMESSLRIDARRTEQAETGMGVFPIDGRHDFGTPENAFGDLRPGHVHAGQDILAATGTPLLAVTDAVVLEAATDGSRGNYLILFNPEAKETYVYMHMVAPSRVKAGGRVTAGERVGEVGCTGNCFGPHLHFEVRRGRGYQAEAVDPLPQLRRWDSSKAG